MKTKVSAISRTKKSGRGTKLADGTARKENGRAESSGDRLLAVLQLFSEDRPTWTVEEAAEELRTSIPTAYRYFKSLARVGMITSSTRADYTLGPAFIEMDRLIRLCDPLLNAARPIMEDLIRYSPEGSAILLCRVFRDRVICIHQVRNNGPQAPVSYERGRPMPLFRGATSKVVLANLPTRKWRDLFAQFANEIKAAGLGHNWGVFKENLSAIRRAGGYVARGEIDPGRVGIAAPIFDPDGGLLGSLSSLLPAFRADESLTGRIFALTTAGAREIENILKTGPTPRTDATGFRRMNAYE